MIVLRPDEVSFGSGVWAGVTRVTIDRLSARTLESWGEEGPALLFVDVDRQRVVIRVTQEIEGDDFEDPLPGEMDLFTLITGSGSDAQRRRVRATAVVESVLSKVSGFGATRTVTLIAVSEEGDQDPIEVREL